MKKHNGLLLVILLITVQAIACNGIPDSPQDYRWGAFLVLPRVSSWYRVELPQEVYLRSEWPDLRDVRVFNQQGVRVPFTLEAQRGADVASSVVPLHLLPLLASPAPRKTAGETMACWRSAAGKESCIASAMVKYSGQSYLLGLPDSMPENYILGQLNLAWAGQATNWNSRVSLFVSRDRYHWTPLLDDVLVMALTRGDAPLKSNTIHIAETLQAEDARYLLMVFEQPQLPLTLTDVSATLGSEISPPEQVQIAGTGQQISATEVHYQWQKPQPFRAVSAMLVNEGELPVEISWRNRADAPWHPFSNAVLWRRHGHVSAAVSMPGEAIQAVRFVTLNARLPASLPKVIGSRDRVSLIFNAQGKGPFVLAWGNKVAEPAAVTLDKLIPSTLLDQQDLMAPPLARPQATIPLGPKVPLSAMAPARSELLWQTILLWAAILPGPAALVWVVYRFWREPTRR